ncbi:hypothetical protein R3P38DRAFT_2975340 [Favolaschia claudopus]|uniref:Uncharacterized protein n=1 Tax=Favolaschia claudopus TaxID=2862362 RepID=A0AAW0B114_9AGAR
MAEVVAGFLGAAATAGAATLVAASGFTGRHENSLREEIQATKRCTADFMANLQSGHVTGEEQKVFWETRTDAIQAERSYSEALDRYKNASWIRNPVDKLNEKTEVRRKKRLTRKYNQFLESLNESMYSGSDTSSTAAAAGSPPLAVGIRGWADVVAANANAYSNFTPYSGRGLSGNGDTGLECMCLYDQLVGPTSGSSEPLRLSTVRKGPFPSYRGHGDYTVTSGAGI